MTTGTSELLDDLVARGRAAITTSEAALVGIPQGQEALRMGRYVPQRRYIARLGWPLDFPDVPVLTRGLCQLAGEHHRDQITALDRHSPPRGLVDKGGGSQ